MNRIKLKICGVKTVGEASALSKLNIDFIGLNFVPTSSRCLTTKQAESILQSFQGSKIIAVGIFQSQPLERVNNIVAQLNLTHVQLHGQEPAEYTSRVKAKVIKAVAVSATAKTTDILAYTSNIPADYYLLDRERQGEGELVSLGLAREVVEHEPGQIFLSGGLTPDNLAASLAEVQPYAIDIASGVRSNDTIDIVKVARCLEIIDQFA